MGRRRVVAALVGGVVVLGVAYPAPVIGAGALATSSDVAPIAPFEDLFVGVGEAEVLDWAAGVYCTTAFVLLVYKGHEGWVAQQKFAPACDSGYFLNTWPFFWALFPDDYILQGNWETGFVGDAPPFFFFGNIQIGPYEEGTDIPASGVFYLPGPPPYYTWSGTVTDVGSLV